MKRLVPVLMLFAAAVLVAACGGGGSSAGGTSTSSRPEIVSCMQDAAGKSTVEAREEPKAAFGIPPHYIAAYRVDEGGTVQMYIFDDAAAQKKGLAALGKADAKLKAEKVLTYADDDLVGVVFDVANRAPYEEVLARCAGE